MRSQILRTKINEDESNDSLACGNDDKVNGGKKGYIESKPNPGMSSPSQNGFSTPSYTFRVIIIYMECQYRRQKGLPNYYNSRKIGTNSIPIV